MQKLRKSNFENLKNALEGIHCVGYVIGKGNKKRKFIIIEE